MAREWTVEEVKLGLRYIISCPPEEYGGFHPQAVETAQEALKLIEQLTEPKE
jgi:hypothetical protein